MPWTPHAYSKQAVKFLLEHAAAALFLDPGLGKTSITLAAIKMLKKRKLLNKVLVIAPLRVCHSVWPKELEKWTDFHDLKIAVLHGPNKDEELASDADIYVINPEGLEWLTQVEKVKTTGRDGKVKTSYKVDLRRWKKLGFDTLVIDELTKFKHTNSGRFKILKLVVSTFARRWGLTGSPMANGLLDLFGQCYVLDEGRTLGPYISHYRSKYFNPSRDGFNWVLREGADQEIYERIQPLALRMDAKELLDMPKVVPNDIKIQLPDKVMGIYLELEDQLITMINDDLITAASRGVAAGKCRQVASGGIYRQDAVEALIKLPKSQRETIQLHDLKTEALADLVEELQGSPLLCAYDFGHDLERLQAKFGKDVPYIGGGVTAKRAKELEDAWNRGELPLLLAHPQSAGHGLNLQEAGNHVAWYTLTWDYELYDQFNRRVLRQGNKHKRIFIHHLLAEHTIDELVLASLKDKRSGQNSFFDALKKLQKKRK